MLKHPELEKASIEIGQESMFESWTPFYTGYQMPQVNGATPATFDGCPISSGSPATAISQNGAVHAGATSITVTSNGARVLWTQATTSCQAVSPCSNSWT